MAGVVHLRGRQKMLTCQQICERFAKEFGVEKSDKTVYRWMAEGRFGPVHMIGRSRYVQERFVDRYFQELEQGENEQAGY